MLAKPSDLPTVKWTVRIVLEKRFIDGEDNLLDTKEIDYDSAEYNTKEETFREFHSFYTGRPQNPYTVILLYPDYVASDWPYEAYTEQVYAPNKDAAIEVARAMGSAACSEIQDPDDFAVLAVIFGHHTLEGEE